MIFYFTATGNSLYAARQIGAGDKLVSIAQELRKNDRHYKDDAIGIVVPLFEFDLPSVVEEFIMGSTFNTDYFFVVSTFGMHSGGIAERVSKRLEAAGRRVDYYNTVIMVDNALQVFDMAEQMRIDPEKKVDEHLAAVRADIESRRHYIQPATQEEIDFYEGYMAAPAFDLKPRPDNPLYRLTDACIGCGTCSRVCPMRSIRMEDGKPTWDYSTCAGCYACVHACPKAAIRFAKYEEPNPEVHYRNPHVTLADLMRANG
ncbi:MAG: EFR1 family ferrodoxin [Atopobiaceae bacterium]|nr:EFR1 family ferrodoxin [Atopobiaceae bacterium]